MNNPSDLIVDAREIRALMTKNAVYQKKLVDNINRLNNLINNAKNAGRSSTCFIADSDVENEIREMYCAKGYRFRPTGIVGGVMQSTQDITW